MCTGVARAAGAADSPPPPRFGLSRRRSSASVLALLLLGLPAAPASRALEIAPAGWDAAAAPLALSIPEIQGAAHRSPHAGALVSTQGIVTSLDGSGFTLQDPLGDADP